MARITGEPHRQKCCFVLALQKGGIAGRVGETACEPQQLFPHTCSISTAVEKRSPRGSIRCRNSVVML